MKVVCDYCQRPAERVDGGVLYPHRPALRRKWYWRCEPCQAWVGCHEDANHTPLGGLANAELREVRQGAHSLFDPLWMSGRMSRSEAYAWLASVLQMDAGRCHIGWMDVADCHRVMDAVLSRPGARDLIERQQGRRPRAQPESSSLAGAQRLFVGLMADAELQDQLTSYQRQWTWSPGSRLVPQANFHLTLRFLGATDPAMQDKLVEGLGRVVFEPFELQLTSPGAFDGGISWVGPERSHALDAVRVRVDDALRGAGVSELDDAWSPHVTLARKSARSVPPRSPIRLQWQVQQFSLVCSERGEYRPVATWPWWT